MSISVIVGPPNSGRTGAIRARLERALDREPVLVVPTADDVARFERELCGPGAALLGASITTFHRLTDEVAVATGAVVRPVLSEAQRLAVVRSVLSDADLRVLSASRRRAGFAPALERLIGELQAALVTPDELLGAADELDGGEYESELARLYAGYMERREAAGRDDAHSAAAAVVRSLRDRPEAWTRPVLVYGFDDLTEEQLDLLSALGATGEVTVAVNYEDSDALTARANLLAHLRDDLAANVVEELPFDPSYTASATLRELDRRLFGVAGSRVEPDGGIALIECGGERGEAEAVGGEIARLLAGGVEPDDVVVVLRRPDAHGILYDQVLGGFGIPVAVEASVPLPHTAVGRGIAALGRCAAPGAEVADLLDFFRASPGATAQSMADWVERRARREGIRAADEVLDRWKGPPAALVRLREADGAAAWLRELGTAARRLAEDPHRGLEPVDAPGRVLGEDGAPFDPLETRAAQAAASTLEELAALEALPGCSPPPAAEALEALDDVRVPLWRGPTEGRVRVLSPYRVRAARARHLFCASLQDGEFPGPDVVDPLLGDERRRRLGIRALAREDPALEERYLFHACVARPTERVWLSWRSSDEEGRPLARSPFVDDALDLLAPNPDEAEKRLKQVRGLDKVVFPPADAPSRRALARSLAAVGLRREPVLPGPLRSSPVLAELADRNPVGAGTIEKWIECSYRWFVDHELKPQRLDPQPEALTTGSIVHEVLERLYRDPPGSDRIPRPGDLERWKGRAHALLAEGAERHGLVAERPLSAVALERMRAQIDRLLERESRSETELRPSLIEASFGQGEEAERPPLDLGDLSLHGMIDRVDVTPDGGFGLVYDYKTSTRVTAGAKLAEQGKLQLQLYAQAIREQWGIEPLGGLYYQLGGSGNPRPRGLVAAVDEAIEGLDLTRTDVLDPDEVDATVAAGVETARERAAAMRRGSIARDPNRGRCPTWCTYQPICRLERSIAPDDGGENGNGNGAT